MLKQLRAALVIFGVLTLVTGVIYPLLVYVVAQTTMANLANGSIIESDGKAVGSELIGQPFKDPQYFWGRPSSTGGAPYSGLAGSGSNMGPTNPALEAAVKERIEKLKAADPDNKRPVPGDLVYASASGLDPHISLEAAMFQANRVAKARTLTTSEVEKLIQEHTLGPTMGVFGQRRVHVLQLNLALDKVLDRAK